MQMFEGTAGALLRSQQVGEAESVGQLAIQIVTEPSQDPLAGGNAL